MIESISIAVGAGIAFALAIVKLTPTKRDDEIVGKVAKVWYAVTGKSIKDK